jgi:hypothetical protein
MGNRFKAKLRRDKEGHYRLMKGTIQQEGAVILNIYSLTYDILENMQL